MGGLSDGSWPRTPGTKLCLFLELVNRFSRRETIITEVSNNSGKMIGCLLRQRTLANSPRAGAPSSMVRL